MNRDPQENDPKKGPIIREAAEEAERRVIGRGVRGLGSCHAVWAEQKKILKEKGINWKSPQDMNPGTFFD